MANSDNPHGFAAIRRRGGGPLETQVMRKLVGFGTAIFKNDIVMQKAGDATFGAVVEPGLTTPGTTQPSGTALNYSPASTAGDVWVFTDWDLVMEAQDNNDTDGFTPANKGLNANMEAGAGRIIGNSGLSGHELDESTFNTATLDVHLIDLFKDPTNAYGSFARVEVHFCQHRMAPGALSVGV